MIRMNDQENTVAFKMHAFFPRLFSQFAGRLAKRGVIIIIDQAIVSASNFLTSVIIGRVLAKEAFGIYALGLNAVLLMVSIQSTLILTPYAVYCPRYREKRLSTYTGSTIVHQLAFSIMSILVLMAGAVAARNGLGPVKLRTLFWTLAGVILFVLFREYARQINFAQLKVHTALLLDIAVVIIQIAGLVLAALLKVLSPKTAFWIIGLANCGPATVWLLAKRPDFIVRFKDVKHDFSMNIKYAKWLFAGALTYWASVQIQPWLLSAFHGPEATGLLAACQGVLFFANPLLLGMTNFLLPHASHLYTAGGIGELKRLVKYTTRVLILVMGFFCAVMMIWGSKLVYLIYGHKYTNTGMIVAILALSQFSSSITFPANSALLAIHRPDVGFKSFLLALVITVTVGVWLVKSRGVTGVAEGLLLAHMVAAAYRLWQFSKLSRSQATQTVTETT